MPFYLFMFCFVANTSSLQNYVNMWIGYPKLSLGVNDYDMIMHCYRLECHPEDVIGFATHNRIKCLLEGNE